MVLGFCIVLRLLSGWFIMIKIENQVLINRRIAKG